MNAQPQRQPAPPQQPPPAQARHSTEVRLAIVETRWQDVIPTLATKADLREAIGSLRSEFKEDNGSLRAELKEDNARLRAELKEDNARLRTELKEDNARLRTELKGEIAELRTEMHKMDATITRWMLGAIVGLFIGLGTLYFAQQRSMDNAISRLERLYAPVLAAPQPVPAAEPPQAD